MPESTEQRILVCLLRLGGTLTGSAFLAMFLPVEWMASTHVWLGLGEFPRTPIVDYLTRSISALYGFHGVFLWIISSDVVRYKSLVYFAGVFNVLFGLAMLSIDLHAGMPTYWTAIEGPFVFATGWVILYLAGFVAEPDG